MEEYPPISYTMFFGVSGVDQMTTDSRRIPPVELDKSLYQPQLGIAVRGGMGNHFFTRNRYEAYHQKGELETVDLDLFRNTRHY